MTDHIHIDDIDYPEPEEAKPEKRLFSVTPIRLRHLVWLVGFGGLVGGVLIFGSPHLKFTYSYTKHGDQYHYRVGVQRSSLVTWKRPSS